MSETEYLSFEQIMAADDVVEEDLPVPEWKGVVRIRSLTVGQALEINNLSKITGGRSATPVTDVRKLMFLTLVKGIVKPLIDANALERLMSKNSGAVLRIVKRINELSGVDVSEEEMTKNLETPQS